MATETPVRTLIHYVVAPSYTTLFSTWKDVYLDKDGTLSHRSKDRGILPVAKDLVRELNFDRDNVNPKTLFRMPLANVRNPVESARAFVMRLNDRDGDGGGPYPFDPRKEVLVFIPEVLGTVETTQPMIVPKRIVAPRSASAPVSNPETPPTDVPSVKFDHQKYDEGAFRFELARNVQETWDRLWNDEDPNRTIVAQILHDVFFRWAFKGFKSRPMGILLYGPPGNGKTFLFDKYLTKLGLTLTNTNYAASRFQKGKVGEGEAAMVAEASKCKEDRTRLYLMFIDEIDSIGADRNKPEYSNLIVVGATNYKENLDEALIRDGRLQNHYFLPSLDKDRRLALLCDKLGDTLVDLFQIKSVISPLQMSRIVKKKIQEDVEVLNYFQRNTINFTFAQFDRLRSEVDGVWRLFDQHNPDDINFARMFRELHKSEVTKEQLSDAMKEAVLQQLSQKHEDLIMNAISVYISHNLRLKRFLAQTNQTCDSTGWS
ncbi:P-loop containing nucleoside triphosphate hydrolase protein [Obelidium mucronatum]|nr:P-loop containing nucleoside triphosphate hydrolase protein [Obelidium mucronatum]